MSVVPLPEVQGGGLLPPPPRSYRRVVTALVIVVLLALLLPPYVNLKRFRAGLEGSLARALGRKVTIGSASLRLLPRPGFDVSNFVVYDDPSISAEPMIRAETVTASLRLTSLWRGRLEIASLSLRYPSLNLVRAADGRWNVEGLLARASQVPTAPTTLTRAGARLRFPYIEAEGGRINFKLGQEKKAFALTDADFSLWLEREDEWNMRLNARPVRTDFNLSDTGRLRVSGTFRRAPSLRDTPIDLRATWERAQLGQLTTLVYRRDRGWRGSAYVSTTWHGTPADMKVAMEASVDDLRRYDIMTGGTFAVSARCSAKYSIDDASLSNILCAVPAGNGQITISGNIAGLFASRAYLLQITAKDVPMQQLVRFGQHAKRDLPPDLEADGDMEAVFILKSSSDDAATPQAWTGSGSTLGFVLRSKTLGEDVRLGQVQFSIQPALIAGANPRRPQPDYEHLQLIIAPVSLQLGGPSPARMRATLTRSDYRVTVQGDADLARILHVAQGVGLSVPQRPMSGTARVDVDVTGEWAGFVAPAIIGNAQIRNVAIEVPGFASRLRIVSAFISLAPDQANFLNVSGGYENTPLKFQGSASMPRHCSLGASCIVQFDVQSDQINTDDLNRLLNPRLRDRHWYQFADSTSFEDGKALTKMRAEGNISIGRMQIKSVTAARITAKAKLGDGRLLLTELRSDLLGGDYQGRFQADFSGDTPHYNAAGTLDGISLAQVSKLMHETWAGTLHSTFKAELSGEDTSGLVQSLSASAEFQWRDGLLKDLSLHPTDPLKFTRFRGHLEIADGKLAFTRSSMESAAGIYQVSGTVSLARDLELKLVPRNGAGIDLNGTLQKPRVSSQKPNTEAALKP